MIEDRRAEGDERVRFERARHAVRAVASALRTLRLYPLSHARMAEALEAARASVDAYTAAFGPLAIVASAQGLVFDFRARPYEDDVVADLTRALRVRSVPTLRFLRGLTAGEVGELVAALHRPRPQIERAGGLRAYLAARGVRNLVIEAAEAAPAAGPALLEPLLDAVDAGAGERIAAHLQQAGADDEGVRQLFRTLDRRLLTRPRQQQAAAWRAIGQSLAPARAPWQAALCVAIVRAAEEPWAATLIAQWPPVAAASLVAAPGSAETQGRRVGDVLRSVRHLTPRVPLPSAEGPTPAEARAAAEELSTWDGPRLREQAVRRLGDLLPALGGADLAATLAELETAVVDMVRENDIKGILAATVTLAEPRSREDAAAEVIRAMLARVLSLGAKPLLEQALVVPSVPGDPFVQAMRAAPDETVRVLLEISAEDSRIQIRRRTVDLLAELATGRPELLTPHVLDPRWFVARNAVTVLERIGGAGIVPALRAAMDHQDGHVRREALRAAASVGTPEAVELVAEGLSHREAETRQAAAHWLGVMGHPEAADLMIAVLESGPLSEDSDLKREVIRALGRIGTPACAEALRRVAGMGGSLLRRRPVDDLKREALAALARIEGRPT